MNKYRMIAAGVLAIAMLFAATGFAQQGKTGINGATFLKIGVGARQVALGSAVTTLSGDPNQMFWNPAGIALEDSKTSISLNHNEWLLTMNHDALAFAHDVKGVGTIGVGIIYVGLSDIVANRDVAPIPELESRQADKATGATYSFYNMALNLTLSHKFTDKLALGASLKFIREKIDDQGANSIAGDFGVVYNTGWNDLTLGATLMNLGGDMVYYNSDFGAPIPLTFAMGASFTIAKQENSQIRGLLDLTKRQDSEQLYFTGMEWNLMKRLALRGGYKFNFSGKKDALGIKDTDEGFSMGAGLKLPISGTEFVIDYAYTDFDILDNTHRFTLYVNF